MICFGFCIQPISSTSVEFLRNFPSPFSPILFVYYIEYESKSNKKNLHEIVIVLSTPHRPLTRLMLLLFLCVIVAVVACFWLYQWFGVNGKYVSFSILLFLHTMQSSRQTHTHTVYTNKTIICNKYSLFYYTPQNMYMCNWWILREVHVLQANSRICTSFFSIFYHTLVFFRLLTWNCKANIKLLDTLWLCL